MASVRATLEAIDGLDYPTINYLEHLTNTSGVGTAIARVHLARRMAYHLGKGPAPLPSMDLTRQGLTAWVEARAWQLVDENRRRLPPVDLRREPKAGAA